MFNLRMRLCHLAFTLLLSIALVGCEWGDSGKRVVRIGAILPLTGDLAKYGKTSRAAVELAVEEINSKASKDGVRLEIIFEDDSMNPGKGVSAANKLIETDKVVAILGPMGSSVTLAVAPVAERKKVVLLSPGSSTPKVTEAGDYIFRNALSDSYEGAETAKFAINSVSLRKIAILHINNEFGLGLKDVFQREFERFGGKIVGIESFNQGSRDHRAQLAKLMGLRPEAIYLVGYDEMISIFKQSKEMGLRTQWIATSFLNDQDLVNKIGNAADSAVLAAWDYSPNSPEPRVRKFADKIRSLTGDLEADVFAANSYDAVYLLYEAVKRKGVTSDKIRDGLYSIQDFEGVTGKTSFDRNGDVIKPIRFNTIVNGKIQPFKK